MKNAEYVLEQGVRFRDLRIRETKGGQAWEIYVHKSITDECHPFTTEETVTIGYTGKRIGVSMGTKTLLMWLDEEHHVEMLNDAEREELRLFKDGWRGQMLWIQKHSFDENNDYISVGVEFPNGTDGEIAFMPFKVDTKYKGLKLGVKYVPEELLL